MLVVEKFSVRKRFALSAFRRYFSIQPGFLAHRAFLGANGDRILDGLHSLRMLRQVDRTVCGLGRGGTAAQSHYATNRVHMNIGAVSDFIVV